jgi:hypothetical protein
MSQSWQLTFLVSVLWQWKKTALNSHPTKDIKMKNTITEPEKQEIDNLKAQIAKLQADNSLFVELMNQIALKPNQEVIEWHECSEELPTESEHYLILCEDGDVYIDWFNNGSDEAGNPEDHCPWGDPEWLIEVQDPGAYKVIAWAYLPKGVNND